MQNNGYQHERYGAIARSLPFTTGKIFIVKSSSDTDYTDVTFEFPPQDGINRVYSTLLLAAAVTLSGRKDIVVCPKELVTTSGLAALASDVILYVPGDTSEIGSNIIIKKTITSSAITTSAQDLSSTAFGELYIEQVILKTDSTGLAGSTNFQITTNNTKGLVVVLSEAVANLGANKTVDINTASVIKQRTVLESGKKIQFNGTVGAGTGAGTVDVYVVLRRVSSGAYIVAV